MRAYFRARKTQQKLKDATKEKEVLKDQKSGAKRIKNQEQKQYSKYKVPCYCKVNIQF